MNSKTVGSLFTGTGALDLGVHAALDGHTRLLWYAENDPRIARIPNHHHPGVDNLGDVTSIDWHHVPPVDILVGGTPCQDVSHAGKRRGMTSQHGGTRSNLWVAMRQAIAVLHPKLVIWENVRGVTLAPAQTALEPCPRCLGTPDPGTSLRALGRVLGDLADLRYDAEWTGLRASDIGAPHARYRIFVTAHPQNIRPVRPR